MEFVCLIDFANQLNGRIPNHPTRSGVIEGKRGIGEVEVKNAE